MNRAHLLWSALLLASCGPSGRYVWVHDLPDAQLGIQGPDSTIESGDIISVRLFGQESVSTRVRVPADGRVLLPLIGEVDVKGRRPTVLAEQLREKYRPYFVSPSVLVAIDEVAPLSITVAGEVAHSGPITLPAGASVLHAIAAAGGLTDFASSDSIFVVRSTQSGMLRVRFSYDRLKNAEPRSSAFSLRTGDVVVVE